ncbi:C40 family peptidase [Luteimicrobium subarcticum]|uniref:NlpC/P60 family protein n=1 Tax=Luteimicrobium subarcticum TaxID=620910 RepID=A0A2M8WS97_9MICO|nr:C40 family peptidase [Luteimicrobium subarcticum]PJI93754.1 NlpC/P60 family protein [Luteimicrobium subarcticum]
MTTTPTLDGARPESAPAGRRLLRVGVAAGVATALVGGGLTAVTALPAEAATHAKASRISLSVSDRTYQRSKPPTLTIRSTSGGHSFSGKAVVFLGGKTYKKVWLRHGAAKLHLSKYLSLGKHTVRVTVYPSSSTVARSSATTSVTATRYSSRVVEQAVRYKGVRYVYGGSSPRGFDCSGFTRYVYKHATGRTLPRSSSAQRHVGRVVSRSHAKPGDLVYTPGHVGIYVGAGKIIDAPRPGKTIQVRSMWRTSWTFIHVSNSATTI